MFHEAIYAQKAYRGFKIGFGQTVPMGMSTNFNATLGKKGTPQKWV